MKQRAASITALLFLMLAPAVANAQAIPDHPHYFWRDGPGFGAMMIFGPLMMILFLVLLVVVVVLLVRWLGGTGHPSPPQGRTSLDILKERFARGEIEKNEFEERRRLLGE